MSPLELKVLETVLKMDVDHSLCGTFSCHHDTSEYIRVIHKMKNELESIVPQEKIDYGASIIIDREEIE